MMTGGGNFSAGILLYYHYPFSSWEQLVSSQGCTQSLCAQLFWLATGEGAGQTEI